MQGKGNPLSWITRPVALFDAWQTFVFKTRCKSSQIFNEHLTYYLLLLIGVSAFVDTPVFFVGAPGYICILFSLWVPLAIFVYCFLCECPWLSFFVYFFSVGAPGYLCILFSLWVPLTIFVYCFLCGCPWLSWYTVFSVGAPWYYGSTLNIQANKSGKS